MASPTPPAGAKSAPAGSAPRGSPRPPPAPPPGAAPAPAVAAKAPVPAPPGWVRRLIRHWIPATSDLARRPDGLTSAPGPDRLSLLVAVGIAVFAATVFEWMIQISPVPPGGDEGTWLLLSYPYVGLPGTFQAPLLSYPPASFPLLGAAVVAGGGPLEGARIFSGILVAGLGLSMYWLGRAMFTLRSVALIIEGAFYAQPDFQQLYYFGSYPNMFGFVFFFLAIAFAIQFLRSRRRLHLALFWVTATVAVLSHALIAIDLAAILALVGLALLVYRRLPRELFSATGIAGAVLFFSSAIGYYVLAPRLGAAPPNYITSSAITESRSTLALPVVMKPFYLEVLSNVIRGSGFNLSTNLTLEILWGASLAMVAAVVILRFAAPRLMTYRVLFLAAWFLSIFLIALATWYANVTTDYRRFAYFLYPATLLGAGFVADLSVVTLLETLRPGLEGVPPDPDGWKHPQLPPWRWRRWDRRHATVAAFTVVAAVLLIGAGNAYTLHNARNYAVFFSLAGHDQSFVDAMAAVKGSSVPGSILSDTSVVDRWPSTLTSRAVFEARPPTGFTYTPANLVDDELANFAIGDRYGVTNDLVWGLIPGATAVTFNASPVYALDSYGVPRQVYQAPPGQIYVTLDGQTSGTPAYAHGDPLPNFVFPTSPTDPTMQVVFNDTGFQLIETISAVAGAPSLSVTLSAVATGAKNLTGLTVKLVSSSGSYNPVTETSPQDFNWFTNTTSGNYSTDSTITGGSITNVLPANLTTGRGGAISFGSYDPTGTDRISFSWVSNTPGAANTATGVVGYFSATQLFALWSARFVLTYNATTLTGPGAVYYFETEYGATLFGTWDEWTVLLLPQEPLGP